MGIRIALMSFAAGFLTAYLLVPAVTAFGAEGGVLKLHDQAYSTDQTWEGTVEIDGVIRFSEEATLTIKPGTVVRFTKTDTDGDGIGENEIYIQGTLHAVGTKKKPIIFTSAEENPAPGDWGAVNVMASEREGNRFEHCVVEYAYRGFHMHFSHATVSNCRMHDNFLAIQCQDSTLDVSGCLIEMNRGAIVFKDSKLKIRDNIIRDNYWAIRFLYGEADLEGNIITDNLINAITFRQNKATLRGNTISRNRKGISAESANAFIYGNQINGNSESGVYLRNSSGLVKLNEILDNGNSGVSIEDSDVDITKNNLVGNRNYAIDNNGKADVDARENWWGTTDKKLIAGMIYDKADDPDLGKVETDPISLGRVVMRELSE